MIKNTNVSTLFDANPKLFTENKKAEVVAAAVISKLLDNEVDLLYGKKKKIKRKLSLNASILLSSDGLKKVYEEFPRSCKFRGKGYENQDLKNMISCYKYWAFMLLPGTAFTDFLLKCEQLGSSNEVKTAMNQYRQLEKEHYRMKVKPLKIKKKIVSFCLIEKDIDANNLRCCTVINNKDNNSSITSKSYCVVRQADPVKLETLVVDGQQDDEVDDFLHPRIVYDQGEKGSDEE
jgi:hypothetical protein